MYRFQLLLVVILMYDIMSRNHVALGWMFQGLGVYLSLTRRTDKDGEKGYKPDIQYQAAFLGLSYLLSVKL